MVPPCHIKQSQAVARTADRTAPQQTI